MCKHFDTLGAFIIINYLCNDCSTLWFCLWCDFIGLMQFTRHYNKWLVSILIFKPWEALPQVSRPLPQTPGIETQTNSLSPDLLSSPLRNSKHQPPGLETKTLITRFQCRSLHVSSLPITFRIGNDRVDIFYQVANPSIWMYYLPDPSMNWVYNLFTCNKLVMACVPGLLGVDISIGSRQPGLDNRLQYTVPWIGLKCLVPRGCQKEGQFITVNYYVLWPENTGTDVGRCFQRSGGQRWVEELHCPMCCPAREALSHSLPD